MKTPNQWIEEISSRGSVPVLISVIQEVQQDAIVELKRRDEACEKLLAIRHSLCSHLNMVGFEDAPTSVQGHVWQWVHEQVDKTQVASEPVRPPNICLWIRDETTRLWITSCGTSIACIDQNKRNDTICPYCNRPITTPQTADYGGKAKQ